MKGASALKERGVPTSLKKARDIASTDSRERQLAKQARALRRFRCVN